AKPDDRFCVFEFLGIQLCLDTFDRHKYLSDTLIRLQFWRGFLQIASQEYIHSLIGKASGRKIAGKQNQLPWPVSDFLLELSPGTALRIFARLKPSGRQFDQFTTDRNAKLTDQDQTL